MTHSAAALSIPTPASLLPWSSHEGSSMLRDVGGAEGLLEMLDLWCALGVLVKDGTAEPSGIAGVDEDANEAAVKAAHVLLSLVSVAARSKCVFRSILTGSALYVDALLGTAHALVNRTHSAASQQQQVVQLVFNLFPNADPRTVADMTRTFRVHADAVAAAVDVRCAHGKSGDTHPSLVVVSAQTPVDVDSLFCTTAYCPHDDDDDDEIAQALSKALCCETPSN